MSAEPVRKPNITAAMYLALEREADFKSEFCEGILYAMAGSTPEHSIIAANTSGELYIQLKNSTCQVYTNDTKVRTTLEGLYAYPDITVVCGEPQFHDTKRDVLINPILLVEVLSDSTEAYDRGKKFRHYKRLESLRYYLLIAQDEPVLELYAYQNENVWEQTTVTEFENTLHIPELDVTLRLSDLYRHVRFPVIPPVVPEEKA